MIKQNNQLLKVVTAKYIDGYKLQITFNDRKRKSLNFATFINKSANPMTTRFKNKKLFKKFRIEHGDLVWGDYEMIFPVADLYEGKIN